MARPFTRLRDHRHGGGERDARTVLRRWTIGAALIVLVGVGVSWMFASAASRVNAQHSRELFRLDANQVGANMNLEVEHETDLLIGAAAFFKDHPGRNAAAFQRWTEDVHAVQRYPELIALVEMQARPSLTGCPRITFAGPAWITRFSAIGSRAICDNTNSLALARGTDRQRVYGIDLLGKRFLDVDLPVYDSSSVPSTAADPLPIPRAHVISICRPAMWAANAPASWATATPPAHTVTGP